MAGLILTGGPDDVKKLYGLLINLYANNTSSNNTILFMMEEMEECYPDIVRPAYLPPSTRVKTDTGNGSSDTQEASA